jgi:hypothetical protein
MMTEETNKLGTEPASQYFPKPSAAVANPTMTAYNTSSTESEVLRKIEQSRRKH